MAYRWTQQDLNSIAALQRRTVAQQTATLPPKKPAKYRNAKVTDQIGNEHASTKQFRRWQELQLLERSGEIRHLRREVPFALVVGGVLVGTYIADHVYEDGAATIVEDVKSPPTRKLAAFRIKAKLMQAIHGIQIREI